MVTSWEQFAKIADTLISMGGDGPQLLAAWDGLGTTRRTLVCDVAKKCLLTLGAPPAKLAPVAALACLPVSDVLRDADSGRLFAVPTLLKRLKALHTTLVPAHRTTRGQKLKSSKTVAVDEEGLSVDMDPAERAEIEAELAALGTVELTDAELGGLRQRVGELFDIAGEYRRTSHLEALDPLDVMALDAATLEEAGRLLHQDIIASKRLASPTLPQGGGGIPSGSKTGVGTHKAVPAERDPLRNLRQASSTRSVSGRGVDPHTFFASLKATPDSASVGGTGGHLLQSGLPLTNEEGDSSSEDDDEDDPGVRAARYLARALRLHDAGQTGTARNSSRKVKKLRKLGLGHPLANRPLKVVKFGAGKRDDLLGLEHIDSVSHSGERSMMQWLRDDVLLDISETVSNKRNLGELKFLCFLIDLMLREPALVAATKSGSSSVLDVVGRRCLLLQGILTEELQWASGERLLPAATLKSSALDVDIKRRLDKILKESGPKVAGAGAGQKPKDKGDG